MLFVPRQLWGAEPPKEPYSSIGRVNRVTIHITEGEIHDKDVPDEDRRMRGIQRVHQEANAWNDLGYHWVVGRTGRIYEGRPISALGAHVGGGLNTGNIGVAVIAFKSPTTPQLASLNEVVTATLDMFGLPPAAVSGHGELRDTTCPGEVLSDWVHFYRRSPERWAEFWGKQA